MSIKLQPNQLLQQQIKGRFVPTELHSRSDIALTFNAFDQQTQLPVVLKYYQGRDQRDLQDSVQRGVMLHAQLRSQQVIPIIDFGVHSQHGGVWCVQQKQEHPNLTRFVRTRTRLDSHLACSILLSLCEALQVLHQDTKIHGNLKPNNVFIRTVGQQHQALISDIMGPNLSRVHKYSEGRVTFNDPAFFTYEQASGKEMNLHTDIGAIGLVGYFMLTGEMPFEGRTVDKVLTAVIIGSGRLKVTADQITGDARQTTQLARIVSECLSKQASNRPKSLEVLAQALKATLALGAPAPTPAPATQSSPSLTPPPVASSLGQTLARGAISAPSNGVFGPPTLTPAHGLFNPLMGGQTMGFDAITDDVLSQLTGGQESSTPVHSSPVRADVMIPEPPEGFTDPIDSGPKTMLGGVKLSDLQAAAESHELSAQDQRLDSTPIPAALYSTFMGSPQVVEETETSPAPLFGVDDLADESTRPLSPQELSALNQRLNAETPPGGPAVVKDSEWGDLNTWGGFSDESSNARADEVVSSPVKPTVSEPGGTSLEVSSDDFDLNEDVTDISLSEQSDQSLEAFEEEAITDHSYDGHMDSSLDHSAEHLLLLDRSMDEPTIMSGASDDLQLDVLFEQAAQDLLQDEETSHLLAESLDGFNELAVSLGDLDDHEAFEDTVQLSPELLEMARSIDVNQDDTFGSAVDLQSVAVSLEGSLGLSLSPEVPNGHGAQYLPAREIEVGGAGARDVDRQAQMSQTSAPRAIEDALEHTQLEHQKLEESFPDVPAWRSLVELKDQPQQLYQALLSIPLPLSGQLLPFSQFQLEVSGREEGYFVPAPSAPLPHIPVVSNLIKEGEFSNEVSGMWTDADASSVSDLERPEPISVGKPPPAKQSSNGLLNLLIFLVAISVIGGVVLSMNGITPGALFEALGLGSDVTETRSTRSPYQRRDVTPNRVGGLEPQVDTRADSRVEGQGSQTPRDAQVSPMNSGEPKSARTGASEVKGSTSKPARSKTRSARNSKRTRKAPKQKRAQSSKKSRSTQAKRKSKSSSSKRSKKSKKSKKSSVIKDVF